MTHEQLKAIEGGMVLLSSHDMKGLKSKVSDLSFKGTTFDEDPKGIRLSNTLQQASTSFDASAPLRMAIIATSWAEFENAVR